MEKVLITRARTSTRIANWLTRASITKAWLCSVSDLTESVGTRYVDEASLRYGELENLCVQLLDSSLITGSVCMYMYTRCWREIPYVMDKLYMNVARRWESASWNEARVYPTRLNPSPFKWCS